MKELKAYKIQLLRLSYGKHQLSYEIDADFLNSFEQDILQKCNLLLELEINKGDALIEMFFSFKGVVSLNCDRSLELFESPLEFKEELFLKFGEKYEELKDGLIQIPTTMLEFDISQTVLEFLLLHLPAKRLHPKYENEEDFFYSSEDNENIDSTEEKESIDPRWAELNKLKNKK